MVSTEGGGADDFVPRLTYGAQDGADLTLLEHLRIAQCFKPRELEEMAHPHRREAGRLDRLEIPAASLDVEDLLFLADQIALAYLDGSIAASVQDQRLVPPQQARGVHARAQLARKLLRLRIVPQTLHVDAALMGARVMR